MLRRNRKKDDVPISDDAARAYHMPSPSASSSVIARNNSPPIHDTTNTQPMTLPNAFPPHAKTPTVGSNSSGSGPMSTTQPYPQSSAQQNPSLGHKFGIPAVPSSPQSQDREMGSHQSSNAMAHVPHPSAAQNQYQNQRGGTGARDNAMLPPASRSLKGTRQHQHVYTDNAAKFPFSQSVDALGQESLYATQGVDAPIPSVVPTAAVSHQQSQSSSVGRSQSALNFLLSKARASFSSSSNSPASASSSAAAIPSTQHSGQSALPSMNPSISLSTLHASGSLPAYDDVSAAGRAEGIVGRNRVASESSGSLLQNYGPRPSARARPSFGEESAPASSPTKRGFFSRERKASLVSLGKSSNAAKQAFSNSPLSRAPLMRYESPSGQSRSTNNFISQFSKSQTDLHYRPDFPSPPSTKLDLPALLPPSQSSGTMSKDSHGKAGAMSIMSASGDSAYLRSPSPNVAYSKSVDDLSRGSSQNASPDMFANARPERELLWNEHGLAHNERGRASDTGALGVGRARGSSMTLNPSPSVGHVSGLAPSRGWSNEHESHTYDSPRHQRKASRPQINIRAADANISPSLISPRSEVPKPVLGPGVSFDGLLYRNMNISMSINQLNGKDKEKDISKGWKPFRVIIKEGRMYFYKPSSSVADEIKLLFPTTVTPAELASRRDQSPSRLSPNSPGLSSSSSAPGLTMEDLKRNKVSTRDLLAATSSQDQEVRLNARKTQKDSRLSAIMDTSEAETFNSPSMQPASLPAWAHANAHADLLLSPSDIEPETWVDRIQGGPAAALAHEYVYATQADGHTSSDEEGAMLRYVSDELKDAAMPLQVFLSAVRKWSAIALDREARSMLDEQFQNDVRKRLETLVDADMPATLHDEANRVAVQDLLDHIAEQAQLRTTASKHIPVQHDYVRGQTSLHVPNESQRQLSTSAPSHFNTSPFTPPMVPTQTEKESRRMTAFFRGAVRPMGLMSSSSSTLGNEQAPRSYHELLAAVGVQKPSSAIPCGSSRVSVWHNAQRSYVFNLTPSDGGHILLQAPNAQELQDWCNAIEQASKVFARSYVSTSTSTEMARKGSGGGVGGTTSSMPSTSKPGKAPLIPLYGTDIKVLYEHEGNAIPLGLIRMLEEVERRGLREQGLYRISGAKSAIEALKAALTTQPAGSVNVSTGELSDVHTIAGAIKQWFRDLPDPAIPFTAYHALIAAERIESEEDRLYAFRDIIWDFPRAHFELLKRISAHLAMVCAEGKHNLMAPHNIGLVFGTSLLNPPPGPSSVAESFGNIGKAAHIVKIIVTTHDWLFEPEPEPEPESEVKEERGVNGKSMTTGMESVSEPAEPSRPSQEDEAPQSTGTHDHTTASIDEQLASSIEDVHASESNEGHDGSSVQDMGESTLTVSTGGDTSGNTTIGYDLAEPITPADGSEVGIIHSYDDSTPRQSLAESDSPAPWLDNPLLTVDEGTIDSHASDSSMMRAVLGAHPMSPVKPTEDRNMLDAIQTRIPQSASVEATKEMVDEEDGAKMLGTGTSQGDLRPSLSRVNSAQQVFLDVNEDMPGEHALQPSVQQQQQQQQQQRLATKSEAHDRTVESVYLDATDAMAILQSNYEEEQQDVSVKGGAVTGMSEEHDRDDGKNSDEEVEEVLEQSADSYHADKTE